MKVDKIVLDNIELPEKLDQLVIDSVEKGYEEMKKKKEYKKISMLKRTAAALGIIVVGGIIAFPVKALVTSYVLDRMEHVPKEEIDEIAGITNNQDVSVDTYSREFTVQERERRDDLGEAYNLGTFPQNELRQEKTLDKSLTDILYYAQDSSTFYLPDRELTDEELLQIIDFYAKRDYAIMQKNADERGDEQRKAEQEEAKAKLKEAGGITEAEAVNFAKEWMQKLYGESGDGMEQSCYLDTDGALGLKEPVYSVGFGIRSVHNCYFYINAQDGTLVEANEIITSDDIDTPAIGSDIVKEKIDTLYRKAQEMLVDQLGKEKKYEKIICAYSEADGKLGYLNRISFFFVKADGSAYEIGMSAVRDQFMDFTVRDNYEAYRKQLEGSMPESLGEDSTLAMPQGKMVYKEIDQ